MQISKKKYFGLSHYPDRWCQNITSALNYWHIKPISRHTTRKNVDKSLFYAVKKVRYGKPKDTFLLRKLRTKAWLLTLRHFVIYVVIKKKKMNQSCSNMLEFGFCGSFAKSWHPKSLEVERYIYISISRNVDTRKTIYLPVLFSLWLTC